MFNSTASVVICGHQPAIIRRALELNVSCLVLCQAALDAVEELCGRGARVLEGASFPGYHVWDVWRCSLRDFLVRGWQPEEP